MEGGCELTWIHTHLPAQTENKGLGVVQARVERPASSAGLKIVANYCVSASCLICEMALDILSHRAVVRITENSVYTGSATQYARPSVK